MKTYVTLDGRVLDLSGLTAEQNEYFERALADYRAGAPWVDFSNFVSGTANPLLRETQGRITRAVWEHPLFQAARDLEDRLGVAQDFIAAEDGDDLGTDPLADEFLPAVAAARLKGVSLMGLHKAISRGEVLAWPAKPGGKRLLVSRASLDRWEPNPRHQAASLKQA